MSTRYFLPWFLGLAASLSPWTSSNAFGSDCSSILKSVVVKGSFLYVANIRVTGTDHYAEGTVRSGLQLDEISKEDLKNARILSIGEGYGSSFDYFSPFTSEIFAVDPVYGVDPETTVSAIPLQQYISKNAGRLIAASGTHLPFADGFFRLVISHRLVNNFTADQDEQVFKIVSEALRVVAPGGQVRILGFREFHGPLLQEIFARYKNEFEFSTEYQFSQYQVDASEEKKFISTLLVATRTTHSQTPRMSP